jgi:hypothetical protein
MKFFTRAGVQSNFTGKIYQFTDDIAARSKWTPGGHANFNICIKINDLLHLHNEWLKCFVPTVGRRPKIVQIFVRIAEKVSKTF